MGQPSVGAVFHYFLKKRPEEVKQALQTFTKARHIPQETHLTEDQVQSFFGSWFLFEYSVLNVGKPMLAVYLEEKEKDLTSEEYAYFQSVLDTTVFDVFEIIRIDLGQGMRLQQLRTGTEYAVQERRGTYEMEVGEILITRLWYTGHEWQLAPDILGYPADVAPMIHKWVQTWPADYRLKPTDLWEALSQPKIHSIEEGEEILEDFLRDHEAAPAVHGSDVVEWLRESQTIHGVAQRVLAHMKVSDKDDFLELIQLMHLVWNALPSRERGGKDGVLDGWEPGPVEHGLLEQLRHDMQAGVPFDQYESTADLNHAIAAFQQQWITTPLAEYDRKTPRQAVAEERQKNGHPVRDWTVNIAVEQWGYPDDERINALLRAGNEANRQGKLTRAEEYYRQVTQEYPHVHQAWCNLGVVLSGQGRKKEAIEALEKAIVLEPTYRLAQKNLEHIREASLDDLKHRQEIISASALRIGIKEAAFEELIPRIRTDQVQQTRAWRDALAVLNLLVHKEKFTVTPRRLEFTRTTIRATNGVLTHADPEEETLINPQGKSFTMKHTSQPQFPVVDRLYHLLKATGLASASGHSYIPTTHAQTFLQQNAIKQYVALLWGYLAEMDWATSVTRQDMLDEFRSRIDHLVQEVVPERLGHLLHEARKNEWVSQEAMQRHLSKGRGEAEGLGPAMLLSLGEEKMLWEPLEWFGLVDIRWDIEMGGMMRLVSEMQLTELGKAIIPQLADRRPLEQLQSHKVGRNDPCPCGSGKKFKKCHGR